jgi:hypothetical protein
MSRPPCANGWRRSTLAVGTRNSHSQRPGERAELCAGSGASTRAATNRFWITCFQQHGPDWFRFVFDSLFPRLRVPIPYWRLIICFQQLLRFVFEESCFLSEARQEAWQPGPAKAGDLNAAVWAAECKITLAAPMARIKTIAQRSEFGRTALQGLKPFGCRACRRS